MNTITATLERTNADLINSVVFCVGLVTVLASPWCGQWPDLKSTLLSVGCSLMAAAIVTYLSSRYLARRSRIREIMDHWGLEAIYETRQKMNASSDEAWPKAVSHLDAMGWGFRSFRDAKGSDLEAKIAAGMKVRFLVPHPDSETVAQREKEEDVKAGSIASEIRKLDAWVAALNEQEPGSAEVRHYNGHPQDFYFRLDDVVFVGPYLYGKTSQQTISYEFRGPSHGFAHYRGYFERLWNDEGFCG
jgi:hypothetical protein